uniref:Uncharacterized protein n=1 Tax=Rhodnius prolixus TaxID=13249 RepID=T1HBS1_RHOPR
MFSTIFLPPAMLVFISTTVALVLQTPPVLPIEFCKLCDNVFCPPTAEACPSTSRVNDPCGCCPDGICPAAESETCSPAVPCERGYFCEQEEETAAGVCRCRRDLRAVCASDNTTYLSICQMEEQPHKPSLLKWGHCDSAPHIVSGGEDVEVLLGQPLAVDCEIKGAPIPSVTWYFNEVFHMFANVFQ